MIFSGDGGMVLLPPPPPPPQQHHHLIHPGMVFHQLPMPVRVPVHIPPPPLDQLAFVPRRRHLAPPPPPAEPEIEVRDVWEWNLAQEMSAIAALLPTHPVVCIDTEFPGAVHDSPTPYCLRGPEENYALVRRNADELKKLLQLGVALAGRNGGRHRVVWQFNFRGFDEARDPHAPASVAMLRAHGMDFGRLREDGVDPRDFADEFARSGLASPGITWVAFSGSYDFAYLAKVLRRGKRLPHKLDDFRSLVEKLFGRVLDVKYIARACCGLRGGLDQVAAALGVSRAAGRAHNAGSDSLLTADVLLAMLARYFPHVDVRQLQGAIDGLTLDLY